MFNYFQKVYGLASEQLVYSVEHMTLPQLGIFSAVAFLTGWMLMTFKA